MLVQCASDDVDDSDGHNFRFVFLYHSVINYSLENQTRILASFPSYIYNAEKEIYVVRSANGIRKRENTSKK